ncbi:MAG: lipid II:glycine glycyltransferase FemX [Candidatus Sulfotelmatobacter sp.]
MSLVTPISAIEVRSSRTALPAKWFEVRPQDLPVWNDVLLSTSTSLYQYPFWNEPYRPLGVTPHYLAWGTPDHPLAFVCILTIGFGPAKIGLVFRGPAPIQAGTHWGGEGVAELFDWARAQGYIFIRFTHSDPEVLTQLATAGHAEDFDAFPYLLDYPVLSEDYIVEQRDTEDDTLAGFDREARRKIRRAAEAGYEFGSDDSPEALARLWPLYQECAQRKHFRIERPLGFYTETMRLARAHNRVRVYFVRWNGRVVGSTLVFRDRTTAHCQLAAFDAGHRQAAAFLHWHSMRDMYRMGTPRYNLGPGPGSLARFKSQFCANPARYPAPLTIVLNEHWFRLWRRAFLPMAKPLQPMLRGIAFLRARLKGARAA